MSKASRMSRIDCFQLWLVSKDAPKMPKKKVNQETTFTLGSKIANALFNDNRR